MLIEASRGGHTTVANLLLSQPRDSSPIETPSVSPAGSVRHLVERPNPDPVASVRSGGAVVKVARGRGGRDEGDGEGTAEVGSFLGQAEIPRTMLRHSGDGCGATGEEDTSDLGTSKAKRQKVASDSVAAVPTGPHGIPYPQFPAPVRSKPKLQQQGQATSPTPMKSPQVSSLQYATDSAMAMKNVQNWSNMAATSPFTSTHGSPQSLSLQCQQQERLIASQMAALANYAHLIPDEVMQGAPRATPEELVARRLYNSPEKMACPTIEQQSLTVQQCKNDESLVAKTAQSVFSTGNFSSQIPVPNMKCLPHGNIADTCCGAGSISPSTASCDTQVTPNTCLTSPPTSALVAAGRGQGEGEERCGDGVGRGRGEGVGGERESRVNGGEEKEDSCDANASQLSSNATVSSERINSSPLANLDATKLIPHLEALADLLQNPTSLENQYLVALAAKAQLLSSSLSVQGTVDDTGGACATETSPCATLENIPSTCPQALPSNLETLASIAAHVSHNSDPNSLPRGFPGAFETLSSLTSQSLADEKPPSLTGLDVVNLLSSSADLTKLLPTLAALEMQGGMGLEPGDNSGLPVPITDPSVIRKLLDEMLCVESNPGYLGALVGDVGLPVRGGSGGGPGGDGISLPMKYLNERAHPPQMGGGRLPKRPYALGKTSFMLDGNFQLDIPHPNEHVDGERNQVSRWEEVVM